MRTATTTLALLVLLAGCGEERAPGATWTAVAPDAFTATQKAQRDSGLAAKDALFGRLFARLQKAMAEGPEKAIEACSVAAPEIAKAVAAEHGLQIGRTSYRLRNPQNVAPAWAERYVRDRRAEPLWLAGSDGRLAALLPIGTKGMCLKCHGDADAIPAPIRAALAERYPHDRATGFAKGDLRGWFWIEIPAP